ncbi:MAG: TIGR03984 family CRISPR-associated protein [Bacteroidetes bacterium]|nr:TIGR03984 family CRISPR-associated protein [Bacteroidota bacterium]
MQQLSENGLTLIAIRGQRKTMKEFDVDISFEEFATHLGTIITTKAFVVAYLDYKVLFGKFSKGVFSLYDSQTFAPRRIQKIRVFNESEEVFYWRTTEGLKGRYRKDEEGDTEYAVDAYQVLYGTRIEPLDSDADKFTKITEKRGTEVILPFNISKVDEKCERVFINTRNYVDWNGACQATYSDARFIAFTDKDKNPLK